MGFQQGLSGLNLSSKALDAIGNNVANSNTVGFKSARANFADVYAASLAGGGTAQVGIGGSVSNIAQQFTQGNVTTTSNPLDLAINGSGFYRLSNGGNISYTRNGQFQVNKDGYVVNGAGLRLTGYAADLTGNIVPGNTVDLQLSSSGIAPTPTTKSQVQVNVDSRAVPPVAMTHGTLVGTAAPTLTLDPTNNSFGIQVDGYPAAGPVQIDVPPGTYTAASLATAVQTAINTNAAFAGTNPAVAVDVTIANGNLQIASRSVGTLGSSGTPSTVVLSTATPVGAGGDTGYYSLLNPAGAPAAVAGVITTTAVSTVGTTGTDNFSATNTQSYTGSTAQTIYDSLGNAHNLTMYFVKTSQANTWQNYVSLDGVFDGVSTPTAATSGTLTGTDYMATSAPSRALVDAGGTLNVTVDGVTLPITLRDATTSTTALTPLAISANYTPTSLAAEINAQLAIVFPGPLPAPMATASVSATGGIVFTSGSTGGNSSVTVQDGSTVLPAPALPLTVANIFGSANPTLVGGQPSQTVIKPTAHTLSFTSAGALTSTTAPLALSFAMTNGATTPLAFTLDYANSSQYGLAFGVNQLLQDGYTSGRLSGLSVAADGTIQGRYSNGKSRNMGQLVLANFNNPNGLQSLGGNQWAETVDSGQPIPGTPGAGSLGVIQSAAVEESNVDLTAELVNMITQQRVYQANAQTIKTQDQVLQTLVNLR